ncbi:MAG: diguanylate cyclase [Alphaproteobacteria bacterium]|nr:diguanylate cyclase [Alphaproteobacteria bacterium]
MGGMTQDFPSLLSSVLSGELPPKFPEEALQAWQNDMAQLNTLGPTRNIELQHAILELRNYINALKENKKTAIDGEVFKALEKIQIFWLDHTMARHGIDEQTGLRHHSKLMEMLENELERRSRHNVPFAFVMARVNGLICNGQTLSAETRLSIRQRVAGAFKKALRPYDFGVQGYGLNFYAILSHSSQDGGTRFMHRVKETLKAEPFKFAYQQKTLELSLSYVVSEPYPGDELDKIMAYMEKDLSEVLKRVGEGEVRFHEMSDLRRYIEAIEKEGKVPA